MASAVVAIEAVAPENTTSRSVLERLVVGVDKKAMQRLVCLLSKAESDLQQQTGFSKRKVLLKN
jgi:hypothetical protein